MIHHMRYVGFGLFFLIFGYFCWNSYVYYFNKTNPEVAIIGVDQNKSYAQDVAITVKGSSPYKVACLSIWLDGNPIQKDLKINRQSFECPVTIPLQNVADGQHTLSCHIVDGTKNANKASIDRAFCVDNLGLQAALVSTVHDHKVQQGRCLHVKVQTNKPTVSATVKALSGQYECFAKNKNGIVFETFIPIECEQVAQEYPFCIEVKDGVGNKVLLEDVFQVIAVPFKKKFLHVQNNRLQSELEYTSLQERDLEAAVEGITRNSVKEKLWTGSFDVPIMMTRITTEFGVIRTSQERGRTVHKALDLVAEPYSVIWAAHNGIVVLKDRFTHSGNTVILDHGHGVISMYYHLHDFADIQVGQHVKKGNPLGRMGMTGFANGQHLHWEIRVNNIAVDPMQWTQNLA